MKIKHILTLCIGTYLIVSEQTWSMSNTDTQLNTGTQQVIEGDVFIIPNSLCYLGYDNTLCSVVSSMEEALNRRLRPQEILVQVGIRNSDSDNWEAHGHQSLDFYNPHGRFPDHLPLYLLDGKNEGDIIEFQIWGKPLRLQCNQLNYQYGRNHNGQPRNFGGLLNRLKQLFKETPNYALNDKNRLIEDEILAIGPEGKIIHGPKDYRWLIEMRRQEHRNCLITWLKSGNPRLGQDSPASVLPKELRQFIAELI